MVLHLLKLEWKKLVTYNLFRILVALYIALLPLGFLIGRGIQLPEETGGTISFYTFPKVWQALGYAGNWMSFFFLGFLGVLLVTNEFSYKTLRQNLITGMSRKEYFFGKYIFMIAVSIAAALYYAIVALGVGFYYTDYVIIERVMENIDFIPKFFLMSFAYMNFAFLLGILLRRMGLALFLYFIYTLLIEMVLRYFFHAKIFGEDSASRNYYPLNAFEDLAPFPIPDIGPSSEMPNFFLEPNLAVILTLVYSAIFTFIAYQVFMKRDL
jgi:ABC-type transport system involved in multi-copper enzyme maturation permease subunit